MSVHNVTLRREGPRSSWGFRLQGGFDIKQPLTIQRVFLGSPSDGELQRGDVLLRVAGADASTLSHDQAALLIKNSGYHMNLTVSRPHTPPPVSPGVSNPTTPVSPGGKFGGSHPLYGASKPTMYAKPLQQSNTLPRRKKVIHPPEPLYLSEVVPTPANALAAEEYLARKVQADERRAVVNQNYRTNQLVLPGAKARHDLPTGSYLRFTNDPSVRRVSQSSFLSQPAMNKISDALMLTQPGADSSHVYKSQVRQSLLGKCSPEYKEITRESMSPAHDGIILPNKTKVVHRQYNTPINMYSTQAVGDTLAGQPGMATNRRSLNAPHRILDITSSPTYQMLQDEEFVSTKEVSSFEHKPVQNKIYSTPDTGPSRVARLPFRHDTNQMGRPKERIQQSRSFKYILTDVSRQSDL